VYRAVVNWADLSSLLILLAGPFGAVAAAHQQKLGLFWLILFGVVGLAFGLGASMASSKLAYRILFSTRLPTGLQLATYLLVPMIFLLLVLLTPILLVIVIYGPT
jgi:hypothetical protein